MGKRARSFLVVSLLCVLLVGATGCIAGSERYEEKRATFWSGLFHGLISPVTLVITLFTGSLDMYEASNVGWGYDCGFFIGIAIILGGGCGSRTEARRRARLKRWATKCDKFGDEIEQEIKKEVLDALRAKQGEGGGEESWNEIGLKIEEKVKRKLKEWAEKD